LKNETDPAMALHLASVLLFQIYTQNMVHAPGRCVPQVIALLKNYMEEEPHQVLVEMQGSVD